MYAFVARAALGGGPNLVGTALLLVLSSSAGCEQNEASQLQRGVE